MNRRVLTRIDVARYLGLRTVQGVRHLERNHVLHPARDEFGILRFDGAELIRVKADRDARGMPVRLTKKELELERNHRKIRHAVEKESRQEFRKFVATMESTTRQNKVWCHLSEDVRNKNNARRVEFERNYIDKLAAVRYLGVNQTDLDDLVARGYLQAVTESPKQLKVREGLSAGSLPHAVESSVPVVFGGPFYARAEVLQLRGKWERQEARASTSWRGPQSVPSCEDSAERDASFWDYIRERLPSSANRQPQSLEEDRQAPDHEDNTQTAEWSVFDMLFSPLVDSGTKDP